MSASEAITKASISSTVNALGFPEESGFKEAEMELQRLMVAAKAPPMDVELDVPFSQLLEKVGEAVLLEAAERAETLIDVLESEGNFPKEKVVEFLTMDVADTLAMALESFGKDPKDVYVEMAAIDDKYERARATVATFAKVLLNSIRKEYSG